MITIQQFMWLIHYGLLALYGWEIAVFAYNRLRHPDAYKKSARIPGAGDYGWDSYGTVALGLVAFHCLLYGIVISGVPIVLMIYAGVSLYCMWRNEIAKPLLKSPGYASAKKRPDKLIAIACGMGAGLAALLVEQASTGQVHTPVGGIVGISVYWITREVLKRMPVAATTEAGPDPGNARAASGDDDGFAYDAGRFRSDGSPGGSQSYNAEADYENALREAQKWADQASSRDNAVRWADKFEQLAGNPSLHAKDKLRYKLAAMLLRERLKGQGAQKPAAGGAAPSDADLSRLGLPVPPQ